MNYSVEDELTQAEVSFVQNKLVEYADQFTSPRDYREFPEAVRGRGYGHRLLERMEQLGQDNGCRFAKLDTFEFEARAFYESHGYAVQAKTEDFPTGHTQYHLTKMLSP